MSEVQFSELSAIPHELEWFAKLSLPSSIISRRSTTHGGVTAPFGYLSPMAFKNHQKLNDIKAA
jgi:hypothetical protein